MSDSDRQILDAFIDNIWIEKGLSQNTLDSIVDQIETVSKICINSLKNEGKIIIMGNGGSAAISSHVSVDLTKNAKIKSLNFLTCSNSSKVTGPIIIFTPDDCRSFIAAISFSLLLKPESLGTITTSLSFISKLISCPLVKSLLLSNVSLCSIF